MERERLLEVVLGAVAKSTGLPRTKVKPESRFLEDLDLDSLAVLEVVMAIEEALGISIPDGVVAELFTHTRTVGEFAEALAGIRPGLRRHSPMPTQRPPSPPSLAPFSQLCGRLDGPLPRPGSIYEEWPGDGSGHRRLRRKTDGMVCIEVPSALVELGSPDPDSPPDQRPLHAEMVPGFLIDIEPVSTTAFARFLNSCGIEPGRLAFDLFGTREDDRRRVDTQLAWRGGTWEPVADSARLPMILVSWHGANAYSLWAHGYDWRRYTGDGAVAPYADGCACDAPQAPPPHGFLPSEAEWEYAARGTVHRHYPWGDGGLPEALSVVGLAEAVRTGSISGLPLSPVNAELAVSPCGARHMAGNVWNWCRDWYSPTRHTEGKPPLRGDHRAERGGSWVGPARLAQSSYRRARKPHLRGRCLGFRCAAPPSA
ncbi:MAG: SUMF1/EgtB/PvdO family nonheme iron enzyme [Candidatus Sumerlaeia bacterium]|nr:SUMF1/EgtB/PvdO family nonheme iron enzyme [Candidatus Sumerlaeia bacterium]